MDLDEEAALPHSNKEKNTHGEDFYERNKKSFY